MKQGMKFHNISDVHTPPHIRINDNQRRLSQATPELMTTTTIFHRRDDKDVKSYLAAGD